MPKSVRRGVPSSAKSTLPKALITSEKLRKYTIKAIAGEFGFNTSESFSKAFYKKHGIYPSYFLSRLEKNQEKEVKNVLKTILKKSPS